MDVKTYNIEDLEKMKSYDKEVIDLLRNRKFEDLNRHFSIDDLNNKEVMLPMMYATKNEFNTYAIYTQFGDNLKKEYDVAIEIVRDEPELIEGTPLSRDETFIKRSIQENPEVILHMSDDLKKNPEFLRECIGMNYDIKNQINEVIKSNPELLKDKEFVIEATKIDAKNILLADNDIKNNYDLMEQICKGNYEVIDYVAENTEEFGVEGLKATKNVLNDKMFDDAINEFKEQANILENGEEQGEEVRLGARRVHRHIVTLETWKTKIENGELDPTRVIKHVQRLCKDLEPQYVKMIAQYLNIDEAILMKEEKETDEQKKNEEPEEEQDNILNNDKKEVLKKEYQEKGIGRSYMENSKKLLEKTNEEQEKQGEGEKQGQEER